MSTETDVIAAQTSDDATDRATDGAPDEKSTVRGDPFAPAVERAFDKHEFVIAFAQKNGKTVKVKAKVEDYTLNNRKWEYWLKGADNRWYKERELAEAD